MFVVFYFATVLRFLFIYVQTCLYVFWTVHYRFGVQKSLLPISKIFKKCLLVWEFFFSQSGPNAFYWIIALISFTGEVLIFAIFLLQVWKFYVFKNDYWYVFMLLFFFSLFFFPSKFILFICDFLVFTTMQMWKLRLIEMLSNLARIK